ncbi:MAG: type II toxin-antitoxin system Phd/YefM family antitoxin [Desulfarculaceae bacterium]|nr:type II toxin-antitoxin system Phd/YefM family antitoxin [Desulfarculaceae bacterium]
MSLIENYIPITQAKTRLLDMVRSLDKSNTIAITKNGVPEAVLLSMETYEGLIETIDVLSDSHALAALNASAADVKAGRIVDENEVFGAL